MTVDRGINHHGAISRYARRVGNNKHTDLNGTTGGKRMNKRVFWRAAAACALVTMAPVAVLADDDDENPAIAYREAMMTLIGHNFGPMQMTLEGKIPWDDARMAGYGKELAALAGPEDGGVPARGREAGQSGCGRRSQGHLRRDRGHRQDLRRLPRRLQGKGRLTPCGFGFGQTLDPRVARLTRHASSAAHRNGGGGGGASDSPQYSSPESTAITMSASHSGRGAPAAEDSPPFSIGAIRFFCLRSR
ncbi:MAG: cytochrome c [Gammaproteobacteria bacterium]|nr:cytochrome c [Gammaproteobacteria bacterium]